MPPDANPDPTRARRRFAYVLIGLAVVLVLLITPPLVNLDRYRHRIVQTMSDSLGRPVHIDKVQLHLLPLPALELRNVVVSEDPAFGAEPTIRANRVDAILRPSSLWRRRIEFSTIRFATDENGAGPSVNLVRNAAGRWNLDSVFMQAAHVSTAPTSQRKAGPEPRFPYIEATAARINLKLGEEKMPFSLTDTDFALWLPSPSEWHVRLKGRPTRTDERIAEIGLVRLEGTLRRAASMAQVPVDLQANWTGAQLGEATVLLTGQDMGWRGTGTLDAALRGPLADAQLSSALVLHNLRRTDFIPARLLDLTVTCQSHATVTQATLEDPVCSLPTPAVNDPAGQDGGEDQAAVRTPGHVELRATAFDLTSRSATGLKFGVRAPDAWLLDWARLLSPTIPADENPGGSVQGALTRITGDGHQPAFWTGVLQGSITGAAAENGSDQAPPPRYAFTITGSPSGFDLAPMNLAGAAELPLALTGNLDPAGYSLHLAGVTTPKQVAELAGKLPPLGVGLAAIFPSMADLPSAPATPQRLDLTCGRLWANPVQTCTSGHTIEPTVHPRKPGRRRR